MSVSVARSEPGSAGHDFMRDVRPILSNNCFACHGPDDKTRKAKLRLDSRDEALKPSRSGAKVLVPGKPNESALIRRILSENADEMMPPPSSNRKLSPAERDVLRRWVEHGAEYKTHWAFIKPVKPPIPAVSDKAWVRTDIDAFILEKLEKNRLKPSAEASRETLVRRLSLDLRGFGPAIDEIDAALNDASPDWYAKLVDRMLASPHYGEKMALTWLDLARFGDTSGYENDSTRQMWIWRDWVINAYNRNLPFDQFTIEQLAGDLLPKATTEQKIASGFNRNTRFNEEAGSDPEEFVVRYNVDRTNTLGQVWLGMTLGCAECHSHKYDPITQKEYYSLFAFFTGIKEPFTSGNHNLPLEPILKMSSADQDKKMADLKKKQTDLLAKIDEALKKVKYEEPKGKLELRDIVWIDDEAPAGSTPQNVGSKTWVWTDERSVSGKKSMKHVSAGVQQQSFTGAKSPLTVQSLDDKLFVYVWLDPKDPPKTVMLQFNDGTWEHRAYWGEDKGPMAGGADDVNHRKVGPLPKAGEWARLEVVAKSVGLAPSAKITGLAFVQCDGTVYYDKAGITADERHLQSQVLWEMRERTSNSLRADVREALKVEPDKRNDAQKKTIHDYFIRFIFAGARSAFDGLNKETADVEAQIKALDEAIPYVMISEEMPKPRDAFVLIRGDFLQKGEKVIRDVPAIFPRLPEGQPKDRLALARWLVSGEHPLTARVAVNRLWSQMFGIGLVKTRNDFGTQGELPSHPELLDYLAVEFVNCGWDTKALLKKIALSSVYRQSSAFGTEAIDADPHNRLLYRAPRFRLTAEELRDNALAISGLLVRRVGGPSVMPYQPSDFYKGRRETWPWKNSDGEDQYRRGIYTFWRRTSLHPMFAIFDAPSREECSAARSRTNTPLQALVTLNDPTFVEAARVFAQNLLAKGPTDVEGRIRMAFRMTVARQPRETELRVIAKRYEALIAQYRADGKAAAELVKVGQYAQPSKIDVAEHATWMAIANMLLNLDETVSRE